MKIILITLIALLMYGCKEYNCKNYRYKVDVCNNCFGAWFYTDSIRWENSMLIAIDHRGKKRIIKPLEVEEGCFEECN
jgi:hypothetical protein